jgi:hypothetical protein
MTRAGLSIDTLMMMMMMVIMMIMMMEVRGSRFKLERKRSQKGYRSSATRNSLAEWGDPLLVYLSSDLFEGAGRGKRIHRSTVQHCCTVQ